MNRKNMPVIKKEKHKTRYLTIPVNFKYDEFYRFKKVNLIIQEILLKKDVKNITILDIGSGDGQFLKYISEESPIDIKFTFIGIDLYVKKKAFDFNLINGDVEKPLNLDTNSVDLIIAGEIIEHLKYTDVFMKELKRILKKNGDVIITTPNLASYLNRFLLIFGYQPYNSEVSDIEAGFGQDIIYWILGRSQYGNKTAGHLRLFTYKAFIDFSKYCGFKLVKYYPIYFSAFRSDNKRSLLIKFFFLIDKFISNTFPTLGSGMVFHLRKS